MVSSALPSSFNHTYIYLSQTSDNDMCRYIHSDLQFLIHNIMGTSSDSSLLKPKIVFVLYVSTRPEMS